jgi:hypothetical protein
MTEVTSVNGKTGAVSLTATDVAAVPATDAGSPNGVATLNGSGELSEAQLPSFAVTAKTKALGEVSGIVKLPFGEGSTFTAKLGGGTEFEATELPSFRENGTLWVEPNGHMFSIKGISWVGSEPTFKTTGTYAITLFVLGGTLYGLAGLEGPEGKAGNTILSGEGAPAEGLGVSGNFYVNTAAHTIYGPKAGSSWGTATSLIGEKGAAGPASIESLLGICPPVLNGFNMRQSTVSEAFSTAKRARFAMYVVPKEGKITKIWVRNGTTAAGNTRVGILDTGQQAVGEYALLVQSAEIAQTGTEEWQLIEVPEHTYTAGQVIMVGVMNSGTTGTYGFVQGPISKAAVEFKEGMIKGVAVAVPKLVAARTFSTFEYASVPVASMEGLNAAPVFVAVRVE